MPKLKNGYTEKTAKLIFKNSKNTLNTYSKTCSGASQIYTKSLILQLKQNTNNSEYYEENGRVKRDLSIETDFCILRGYYKNRKQILSTNGSVITKSKYSVNRTEVGTIDEINYDSSACGDSKRSVKVNKYFNVNLTSLVVQNLKELLNDWIKKYLLENDGTKEKIETVLDSILHKIELQTKETDSSYTYTVDIAVMEGEHKYVSNPIQSKATSQRSAPIGGQAFRILSNLSVPKNLDRPKKSKCAWKKFKEVGHKKKFLSTDESSKYLFTASSLNFLTLPASFLTKRCATYKKVDCSKKISDQKSELAIPDTKCGQNLDCIAAYTQSSEFNAFPSIYKNMYEDFGCDETNGYKTHEEPDHDQDIREPLVSIEFLNQSLDIGKNNKQMQAEEQNTHTIRAYDKKAKKDPKKNKKSISRLRKQKCIKSRKFTYFYPRKSRRNNIQEWDLIYHLQSILKIISSCKAGNDVKIDINVNIFPTRNCKIDANVNRYEYPLGSANIGTQENLKTTKEDPELRNQNFIPLLDGALSQANYIIMNEETCVTNSENRNLVNDEANSCIDKDSKINEDISELKMMINSLARTTEKLVTEHLTKKRKQNTENSLKHMIKVEKNKAKPSIGVQFSQKLVKNDIAGSSGIKLQKNPKKKHTEYVPHLTKRSTSYHIIESESILKVTDMTSAAQDIINTHDRVDKALTCSLPKSKSLFEISCEKFDEQLLRLKCEDFMKREYVYNICEHNNKPHESVDKDTSNVKLLSNEVKANSDQKLENVEYFKHNDINANSYVILDLCHKSEPKSYAKKITIRPRTSIKFCEGCFYCVLLWIPVLTILCLFYEYVLKHFLPVEYSLNRLIWSTKNNYNESHLRITLTELGF